jgi:hypothetical protein
MSWIFKIPLKRPGFHSIMSYFIAVVIHIVQYHFAMIQISLKRVAWIFNVNWKKERLLKISVKHITYCLKKYATFKKPTCRKQVIDIYEW